MRVRPVKEYNDARLYTGFAAVANGACAPAPNGGNTAPGGGLGLDLAAIAEQLNDIAAELRGEGHIGAHLLRSRGEVGGHDPRRTPAIRPDPQIDLFIRRSRYADFAREACADMGFKDFFWILGGTGRRFYGARVHAYGPVYGSGAAVVEFKL